MRIYLVILFWLFFIVSCKEDKTEYTGEGVIPSDTIIVSRQPKNKKEIINIEHMPDTTGRRLKEMQEWRKKENMKPDFPIDTASLDRFWQKFQENIRLDNKKAIINTLEYPIHAIFFVTFKFSYDCDTLNFSRDEDIYADFDIDVSNVMKYYDFMFCDTLKEIILQTSTKDLLEKGVRYKNTPGLTYMFFPKDYMKVECPNDHYLKFYLSYEKSNWQIEIGGL